MLWKYIDDRTPDFRINSKSLWQRFVDSVDKDPEIISDECLNVKKYAAGGHVSMNIRKKFYEFLRNGPCGHLPSIMKGCVQISQLSWEMAYGPMLENTFIRHDCMNSACVNPLHMKMTAFNTELEPRKIIKRTLELAKQLAPWTFRETELFDRDRALADGWTACFYRMIPTNDRSGIMPGGRRYHGVTDFTREINKRGVQYDLEKCITQDFEGYPGSSANEEYIELVLAEPASLKRDVMFLFKTMEEALIMEREFLSTVDFETGLPLWKSPKIFNLHPGGGRGFKKGDTHTESTKRKIGEKNKVAQIGNQNACGKRPEWFSEMMSVISLERWENKEYHENNCESFLINFENVNYWTWSIKDTSEFLGIGENTLAKLLDNKIDDGWYEKFKDKIRRTAPHENKSDFKLLNEHPDVMERLKSSFEDCRKNLLVIFKDGTKKHYSNYTDIGKLINRGRESARLMSLGKIPFPKNCDIEKVIDLRNSVDG